MVAGRVTYAVRPALIALLAAGAVVALGLAALVDGPGRFLFAVAAAGAAAEALRSALLRPTLTADADGVDVAVGVTRERHPWSAVAAVSTLQPPAAGARPRRRANAVEIDLGERLLVVPAYRLGRSCAEVVAALDALRLPAS
ncbi:MAG: hypothetical protein QOE45_1125 [Frankiaceae bacterium]|nr:hypothetical protein [Frankiaceae bacterium]